MIVKKKLHKIIDEIKDEMKLEEIYRLISSLEQSQNGNQYRSSKRRTEKLAHFVL